ncbi:hypothetical protein ACRB68_14450 [Actinomadura sp. RB68]|uniref:Uncharacterized protein n=1 Tax=Actinomadura macrotermitis TaxID=2585200 RepID=A0A7K0BQF2_9ACTN|nr:hypothetical protein [Actinomadura macrotermitis]
MVALVAGAALTACDRPGPKESYSALPATPEPVSGDGLVLRWRMTGGIAGLGGPGTMPEFSLYGDGRAVAGGKEYRLRPEALRRLLADARAAGLARPRSVDSPEVSDALVLQIRFQGATTKVAQPNEHGGLPAVRFWKRLDPRGWPASDQAAPARAYTPARLAVLTGELADQSAYGRPWPYAPLGKGVPAAGGRCTVLTGKDAGAAQRLAGQGDRWRSEGKVYSVRLRPLLPDESTCADLTRS